MTKPKLTADDVKHVAKLSRLELSDKEIKLYTKQLASILNYFEKLNEVDVSQIAPTSQVTNLKTVLRKDIEKKCFSQKEALSASGNVKKGFFKVRHTLTE